MCILIGAMFEVDYDDPFDTAEQLVNKNITLLADTSFGGSDWRKWLNKSTDPWNQKLAESAVMTSLTLSFHMKTKYGVLRDGIHAIMSSYLRFWELDWGYTYNQGMGWYRSKDGLGNIPISGYLTGKKWPLIEELSLHLLYFQQVQVLSLNIFIFYQLKAGLTSREVAFEEWDQDEVGEGVEGEDDEHDQQNLAPMQMSKYDICTQIDTRTKYFNCSSFSLWFLCGYQFSESCC